MQKKKVFCAICGKETCREDNPFRPFCSERCKLIDLGEWASESYRIANGKNTQAEGEQNELEGHRPE